MKKNILIIGASGKIGHELKKMNNTIGTSTRKKRGFLLYKLGNPGLSKIIKRSKINYVIISINIKNIDKFNSLNFRKKFNNNFFIALKEINKHKLIPIFLSSDYIYQSSDKKKRENENLNPISGYGIHKKNIENFIIKNFKHFLILRLAKVFFKDDGMLNEWKNSINKNIKIYLAYDQIINLIYIDDLKNIIRFFIKKKIYGIYNISNGENISRYKLFKNFIKIKKIKYKNINKIKLNKYFKFSRPLNTSMDTSKLRKQYKFKLKTINDILNL